MKLNEMVLMILGVLSYGCISTKGTFNHVRVYLNNGDIANLNVYSDSSDCHIGGFWYEEKPRLIGLDTIGVYKYSCDKVRLKKEELEEDLE